VAVFGTYQDANEHLDDGKLSFASDIEALPYMTQATRVIQMYLYGRVSPAVMNLWDITPAITVPDAIRQIAGLLAAGSYYAAKYSGEAEEVTPYGQMLWNRGIAELNGIINGTLVIPELVDLGESPDNTGHLEDGMFYPDDSTCDTEDDVMFLVGRMF
jgi:hypothetical protein